MKTKSHETILLDLLELVAALDRRVPASSVRGSATSRVMRED
jgi:hypothetical protein